MKVGKYETLTFTGKVIKIELLPHPDRKKNEFVKVATLAGKDWEVCIVKVKEDLK